MFFLSFIVCSGLHQVGRWIPSRVPHAANLRTCIAFQLYFLWRAGSLWYTSVTLGEQEDVSAREAAAVILWIQKETMRNLGALGGYFLYDLGYLLQTTPFSGFVLHHLIGLTMIRFLQERGAPPPSLLTMYNALAFIAEITNPPLNLRHFVKGTVWEGIMRKIIFWTYTVFRMIGYPVLSIHLHQHLQIQPLFGLFVTIYVMSMVWYRRVIRMCFPSGERGQRGESS